MNLIAWAVQHQNNWRKQYCDEDITVQTAEGNYSIRGTKINPGSYVNSQGVRVETSHVLFMIPTQSVTFPVRRGVKFIVAGLTYEVIIDRSLGVHFDDSEGRTMNIPAKLCSLPT